MHDIGSRRARTILTAALVTIVATLAAFATVSSANATRSEPVAAAARHGADDAAGDDERATARCRRRAAKVGKAGRAAVMRRCVRAQREREARHGADDPAGDDHGSGGHGADDPAGDDGG